MKKYTSANNRAVKGSSGGGHGKPVAVGAMKGTASLVTDSLTVKGGSK